MNTQSQTKTHTPGPWSNGPTARSAAFKGDWATDILTRDKNAGLCVGVLCTASTRPADEANANAMLMAAAPELLARLQELMAWANLEFSTNRSTCSLRDACKAAIAMATETN